MFYKLCRLLSSTFYALLVSDKSKPVSLTSIHTPFPNFPNSTVQDLTEQLEKWTKVLLAYYEEAAAISDKANVFPIDIDLSTVVDAQ